MAPTGKRCEAGCVRQQDVIDSKFHRRTIALALTSMFVYTSTIFDVRGDELSEVQSVLCCAPLAAPMLSEEEAEATADVFKALADPTRVRIVNVLATSDEPVCVCNLVDPLGLTQPTVSHHMKKLLDAGLVAREERGKWAYYSLIPEAMRTLASVTDLKGVCC